MDFNKLSNKEVNQLAKKLYKLNNLIWNTVCYTEEFVHCDEIHNFNEHEEEHQKFLKKLAKAYKKINKEGDSFANYGTSEANFQKFDYFINKLEEAIDKLDE